jgi:hypothetical protein
MIVWLVLGALGVLAAWVLIVLMLHVLVGLILLPLKLGFILCKGLVGAILVVPFLLFVVGLATAALTVVSAFLLLRALF